MKLTPARLAPNLQAEYRKYYLRADALQLFLGLVLWTIAFVGFVYSDLLLFGRSPSLLPLLAVRLLYGLCCIAFTVVLRSKTLTARAYDLVALSWGLLTVLVSVAVGLLRPRIDLSVLILDLVGVFSFYVFISGGMLQRFIPALLLTVFNLAMIINYRQNLDPQVCMALAFSFTLTNLVGVVFSRNFFRTRQAEFLARYEETRVQMELTRLASTDPLTGIYNRRRLLDLADQALYRHRRYGRPFSIMVMDLDGFKKINDTFGHLQGDAVLIEFTRAVMQQKREGDGFGRMGGDEFCLLLPETELPAAAVLAERILASCGSIILEDALNKVQLTTSIGISQAQAGDQTLDSIFSRADAALYLAKDNGRNRYEIS